MSLDHDAPPSYEEAIRESGPVRERPWIRKLNLSQDLSRMAMRTQAPTADECIVHLKLLAAIADLRDEVSTIDSLFGIRDSWMDTFADESLKYKAATRIREKRWAIFVTRAVDRFELWWDRCIPMEGIVSPNAALTYEDIEKHGNFSCAPDLARKMTFSLDNLPPLDVIMVWHAYMLNPRIFLDDSLRCSKMGFWATGMPWEAIGAALDERTFEFRPSVEARDYFESMTGRTWDNLHDAPAKNLQCPKCLGVVHADWSSEIPDVGVLSQFEQGHGYAEKDFTMACPHCFFLITHEALRVTKFRRDVNLLIRNKVPMPGTLLSKDGMPRNAPAKFGVLLPNRIISAPQIYEELRRLVDIDINPSATIADIRDFFNTLFRTRFSLLSSANLRPPRLLDEKLSFRRMMSRYWTNSSFFGLDLVGAVIRQGTFITKMDVIGWIHWPSVESRMDRLIQKYRTFICIIAENRTVCAVPTLDVDLAWHTHQLSPLHYFTFSTYQTDGRFINHDDKIEETRLSDAFETTSRKYQSLTGGQPYSECICWYCEAIRESNNSRNGIFSSFSSSDSTEHTNQLRSDPAVSSDPANNAHISAHSAIHSSEWRIANRAGAMTERLKRHHAAVFWRLQKRTQHKKLEKLTGDEARQLLSESYTYYPIVWGYPVFTPFYKPYGVDQSITPNIYVSNPACMSLEHGAVGNCISGAVISDFTEVICGSAAAYREGD